MTSTEWYRQAAYRAGQLLEALWPRVSSRDRALAHALLEPQALAAFASMPATDQRHAARLCRRMLALCPCDGELAVAALLHDLGKVDRAGRGRVRLPHRILHVALPRVAPGRWQALANRPRRGPLHGFYLLRHHADLGAAWARELGVSPRACALIAAHHHGAMAPALAGAVALLRAEDQRT